MKFVETEQDIPENISIPIKGRSGAKFFTIRNDKQKRGIIFGAVSRLGKKIQIRACLFTFSLLPEKWSFSLLKFSENGKEMHRNNKST